MDTIIKVLEGNKSDNKLYNYSDKQSEWLTFFRADYGKLNISEFGEVVIKPNFRVNKTNRTNTKKLREKYHIKNDKHYTKKEIYVNSIPTLLELLDIKESVLNSFKSIDKTPRELYKFRQTSKQLQNSNKEITSTEIVKASEKTDAKIIQNENEKEILPKIILRPPVLRNYELTFVKVTLLGEIKFRINTFKYRMQNKIYLEKDENIDKYIETSKFNSIYDILKNESEMKTWKIEDYGYSDATAILDYRNE